MKLNGVFIQAFADDVIIVVQEPAQRRFRDTTNRVLDRIGEWVHDNRLKLNTEKCQFMMVKRGKQVTHIPGLKIGQSPIKYVHVLKYLGVYFDDKLNFLNHLRMVEEKAVKIQQKLNRISRATWGLKAGIIKHIYLNAIEKFITYASNAWYYGTKRQEYWLLRIQRRVLFPIAKTYSTVSGDAMCVLAGTIPLDLIVQAQFKFYSLWKLRKVVKIKDLEIGVDNVEVEQSTPFEPWCEEDIVWNMDINEQLRDRRIYTDGSKIDNRVGCAFVYISQGVVIEHRQFRLNDDSTVFQAELYAIYMAVEFIIHNELNDVHIYSDSRSALQAISHFDSKIYMVHMTKNLFLHYRRRISLH
jgi:hypothetical protein